MASGSLPISRLLHGLDAGARHRPGGAGFAVAGQAGIGIDADQAVAGDVLIAIALMAVIFTFPDAAPPAPCNGRERRRPAGHRHAQKIAPGKW